MLINDYQENYVNGWVKIYRSIQFKGYYKKSQYIHLWVHLLIKANHKPSEFWFNGKNVKLQRGQFVTGRKVLSEETGISESQIDRILKVFVSEQQIEQQTNNRNRLITILNYDQYQKVEQPTNNNGTSTEHPQDTNKNDKNKEEVLVRFLEWAKDSDLQTSKVVDQFNKAWYYYEERGWKNSKNKPVVNIISTIRNNWFKELDDFREEELNDFQKADRAFVERLKEQARKDGHAS